MADEEDIPEPTPRKVRLEVDPVTVTRDLPSLDPIVPDMAAVEDASLGDRIRAVWNVVQVFVEEAVKAAEVLLGPGTGPEKKAYVVRETLDLIRALEERVDFIPGLFQGIVFKALEMGVGFLVDRVVGNLKARGIV